MHVESVAQAFHSRNALRIVYDSKHLRRHCGNLKFKNALHITGCGRNNSHILKVNKNQMKQGTQKILLFIKSTYDAFFFKYF